MNDVLAAALCGLGALAVMNGAPTELPKAFFFALGLYGVYRVVRTNFAKVLIGFPAIVWAVANAYSFTADSTLNRFRGSPTFEAAPEFLAATLYVAFLTLVVVAARARLGKGLTTLTLVALGLRFFFWLIPTPRGSSDAALAYLLDGIAKGWAHVALVLVAACVLLVGVGPIAVPALPRRGGVIAGAIGAALLAALLYGIPQARLHNPENKLLGVFAFVFVVCCILVAISLGAIAKLGAKGRGWGGMVCAILGVFGLGAAMAVFDRTEANTLAFAMASTFVVFGMGLALAAWKGAPLDLPRKVIATILIGAFGGGTFAWIATWFALAGLLRGSREPWRIAFTTLLPLENLGLPLFAALLLYLAAPPLAAPPFAAPTRPT